MKHDGLIVPSRLVTLNSGTENFLTAYTNDAGQATFILQQSNSEPQMLKFAVDGFDQEYILEN